MTALSESPKTVVISDHRNPDHRSIVTPGNRIFRLALPMLYAAMGISLGTLAGTVIALDTAPISGQTLMADISSAANNLVAESRVSADAYPAWAPAQASHAAAPAQPVFNSSKPVNASEPAATVPAAAKGAAANSEVRPAFPPAPHIVPVQKPVVDRNPHPRINRDVVRPSRPAAHPLIRPARTELASAPTSGPTLLIDQLSETRTVSLSSFYSEGDLTVADYNAATGTIESSDGRTFLVGTTVAMSNATSWNDYRSGVHYRCSQSGSCTLMRPGVIASNARLI
jgi:hypothetical protein